MNYITYLACNGVAPLNDELDYVQRCSENVPCSRGSWYIFVLYIHFFDFCNLIVKLINLILFYKQCKILRCNTQGYCCPHIETACQSPKSIGHTCLSQKPGTFWYFDTATETCLPFLYSGLNYFNL